MFCGPPALGRPADLPSSREQVPADEQQASPQVASRRCAATCGPRLALIFAWVSRACAVAAPSEDAPRVAVCAASQLLRPVLYGLAVRDRSDPSTPG